MTVIVWDGKTLAADRLAERGGTISYKTKVFRQGRCLMGGAGDAGHVAGLIEWAKQGADPAKYPPHPDDARYGCLLLIRADGSAWVYDGYAIPFEVEAPYAIGSGRDAALAALHMGADAALAVTIAAKVETSVGGGVDTLTLNEPDRP